MQAAIASAPEETDDAPGMAQVQVRLRPCSSLLQAHNSLPPTQRNIKPIRAIFANSTRPEIVAMRDSFVGLTTIEELKRTEPGFRYVAPPVLCRI